LLIAPGDRQLPGAVVVGEVLLIAPADIVRAGLEGTGAVGRRKRPSEAGEKQSVSDVLVALKARRVAVDAAGAAADEEFSVGQLEQTARVVGRGRCRRRGRLRGRPHLRERPLRRDGASQKDQRNEREASHGHVSRLPHEELARRMVRAMNV
jgi:hypothetical protein